MELNVIAEHCDEYQCGFYRMEVVRFTVESWGLYYFIVFKVVGILTDRFVKQQRQISMRKIKYGKKIEGESKELLDLKQGDEICEAVLDTFSDDYLSYITHLVKNTKTPVKNKGKLEQVYHSSDSQPEQHKLKSIHPPPLVIPHPQAKIRHHSESGLKASPPAPEKQVTTKLNNKFSNNYSSKCSPLSKEKNTVLMNEGHAVRSKKKKIEYMNEILAKNDQKTMTFSRNVSKDTGIRLKQNRQMEERDRWPTQHVKEQTKLKQKYVINSEKAYASDQVEDEQLPSIERLYKRDRSGAEESRQEQHRFISNINQYLDNLQANTSLKVQKQHRSKRMGIEKLLKKSEKEHKMASIMAKDQKRYDIDEIMKQNLKLRKKVKTYELKIDELQDDVSSHLIQCKNRDKAYKNKIADLIKILTQTIGKVNSQKAQITSMDELLRNFQHKRKQIKHENDDSSQMEEDISESIIKLVGPQRNSSEVRTKYKKMLQATMPKHEEERKFWRD